MHLTAKHIRIVVGFRRLCCSLPAVAVGSDNGGNGPAAAGNLPSWCGPNKASLGLTDGFGGNSWRW
jgi:ribose transport system substrate-binding protein